MATKKNKLVRFVTPFGSPGWMDLADAQKLLAEDDARWLRAQERDALSDAQRKVGPPRIEHRI